MATSRTSTDQRVPTQRRRRTQPPAEPLGSLTQAPPSSGERCAACDSDQLTTLSMVLTDGTAVRFSSCRRCEHRRWASEDDELSITDVLERTRREA